MRSSYSRLAKQVSEKYLTPGNPTGLTGIRTHPAPRPALINLYNRTLRALETIPSTSAYRTSVTALTKHRLDIVSTYKPEGYDAWLQRVQEKHPEEVKAAEAEGRDFAIEPKQKYTFDDRLVEWDGTGADNGTFEGPTRGNERKEFVNLREKRAMEMENRADVEPEPPLTAQQIGEIEEKIGAGLIEEVIEVAKGELELVHIMGENQVWEELVEKAPETQWQYFERTARHQPGTQAP